MPSIKSYGSPRETKWRSNAAPVVPAKRRSKHLLIYLRVLLLVWRKRRLLSVRSWNFEGTLSLAIDFINRGIDPTVQERHVLVVSLANWNIYIKFVRLIPRRFLFKFINIRQRKHFNTKIASLSRRYLEERSATWYTHPLTHPFPALNLHTETYVGFRL